MAKNNPSVDLKKKFAKNSSSASSPPKLSAGKSFGKVRAGRQSSNVVDKRKTSETEAELAEGQLRQVFRPKQSKSITKVANTVVRADPMNAKGKGMTKLRSPAKKVMYNKFSKKGS